MPASSKSQQRFFGVVKAMQKGDIPKKGKAGKIAKQMSKKDVDDFASTKHKGKPEKVKREQKVRNLIKKMVREELGKLNEKVQKYVVGLDNGEVISGDKAVSEKKAHQIMSRMFDRSNGWVNPFMIGVEVWNGTHPKSKGKPHKMNKKKIMIKEGFDLKKLEIVIKSIQKKIAKQGRVTNARDEDHLKQLIKVYKDMGGRKIKEGTCGYGENGQIGEEPAGPHLIKKKKIKESGRNIAKTILQQLGGNKFIAMTGAKNLGFTNNGLQMKIGRNSKGITHVVISLKSTDTYDVEFIKMRGVNRKVVKKLKRVYADQLGKIFTKYTGLRIRL